MTYSEAAVRALREAARFYRLVGEQNPDVLDNLQQAATTFETIAQELEVDPGATMGDEPSVRTLQ